MHFILGILGSIITILFYLSMLSRSGVNLNWIGWLNPFAWSRRRKWRKPNTRDPVNNIQSPMEATALMMYAMAKASGEITREQKDMIKNLFVSEFELSNSQAVELLSSCSFILQNDEHKIIGKLDKFLKHSANKFTDELRESAYDMIMKIAKCENQLSQKQEDFCIEVKNELLGPQQQKKWA